MKTLRKALSILVATASLITSMSMQPALAEQTTADAGLIPHGTFEGYSEGDTVSQPTTEVGFEISQSGGGSATVATDPSSKSKALKLTSQNDTIINLRFKVKPATTYFVSFDVHRIVPEEYTGGEKTIVLDMYNTTTGYKGSYLTHTVKNNGAIETVDTTVTTGSSVSGLQRIVKMMIKGTGSSDVSTYIDNVYVQEIGTDNFLHGGDVERFAIGSTPNLFEKKGTVVDDSVNGGSKAMEICDTSDASGEVGISMYPGVAFEQGGKYSVSFDVRRDVPTDHVGDAKNIEVILIDAGDNWRGVGTFAIKNNTKSYVRLEGSTTALASGSGRIKFALKGAGFEGSKTYIDNVVVKKYVEPDPTANRIYGGDFEAYAVGAQATNITAEAQNITSAIIVDDSANGGSKAVRFESVGNEDGKDQIFNLYFPVEKDVTYALEIDVRRTVSDTTINSRGLFIDYAYSTGIGSLNPSGFAINHNSSYQTIKTSFTADRTGANGRLKFTFKGMPEGVSTYIDNIKCYVKTSADVQIDKNPSFENGAIGLPTVSSGVTYEISEEYANTGSKSLKLTGTNIGMNYENAALEAGNTYRFGAYVRLAGDAAYGSLKARVMGDGGIEKAVSYSPIIHADNGFVFVSVIYTPTVDETVRLNLWFDQPSSEFVVYVDDIVFDITDTSDVAELAGNLLKNGTFEAEHSRYNVDYSMVAANTAVTPYYSKTDGYVRTGDCSLKVANKNANGEISFAVDNVNPGDEYKISAYVKADASNAAQTISVSESIADTAASSTAGDWVKFEKTVVIPKGTSILYFNFSSDAEDGMFYIDDVAVEQIKNDCEIDAAKLMKLNGEAWEAAADAAFTEGSWKYVVSNVVNYSDTAKKVGAIIAVYDGNKLDAVRIKIEEIAAGGTVETIETEAITVTDATNKEIKTFIWNMDTAKPYDKPLKVLIVGNSLTAHAAAPSKGWLGTWGMAASVPEKDYAHLLQAEITSKDPNAKVLWANFAEFEKYFYNWDADGFSAFDLSNYDEFRDFDADIILMSIGENIRNNTYEGSGYETETEFTAEHYAKIVNYFNPGNDAVVIARVPVQSGVDIEIWSKIKEAVEANSWRSFEMNGWTEASAQGEGGTDSPDVAAALESGAFAETVDPGVLSHPGDRGMIELKNAFWNVLNGGILNTMLR